MSIAKLDKQLCFALYSASNQITKIYRPLLDSLDLTYTQFVVLMALWENDNVSISHLAKRAGLTTATMTPLLKRLEQKHLIKRQVLAQNERQKNISLTQSGRELSLQSAEITEKVFCSTGLSKQEAYDMISLCKKMMEYAR